MNTHDREQLQTRIKQALDQPLDANTQQRLAEMRAQTMHQAQTKQTRNRLVPALALASCAALAFVLLINQPQDRLPAATSITAFEIVSSEDELEMFEELEFYAWLAQQDDAG